MQNDASSQRATGGSEKVLLERVVYSRALCLAARFNHAGRVRALIDDHGAPLNATDKRGRTALQDAAEAGSAKTVKVLVQYPDCRVNTTDFWGRTALHLAAWTGRAEAVNVLVQQPSCDFSITDKDGNTAAERAGDCGHDDIAALIEAKYKGSFTKRL